MAQDTVRLTLPGGVADNGTVTVNYPEGARQGTFSQSSGDHVMHANGAVYRVSAGDFTVAFGASEITVTWKGGRTLASGTLIILGLERYGAGMPDDYDDAPDGVVPVSAQVVHYGSVLAADDDAVATDQSASNDTAMTLDGALVSDGAAEADVARNVTITSAGDDTGVTFTVTGKDQHGGAMVEEITGANAGAASGAKAFKEVTKVVPNSNSAGNVKVGFGDVLGLPFFVPSGGFVLRALVDGDDELGSSTIVGGLATGKSTATSADVRGTIAFNTAPNGTKVFQAVAIGSNHDRGVTQYAG